MDRLKRFLRLRCLLLTSVGGIAAGATPSVAEVNQVCSAWNVNRAIEVLTTSGETAVCQVRYRKPDEGAADQILWRSSNSVAFCDQKAQELASRLTAAGFECREGKLTKSAQRSSDLVSLGRADDETPVEDVDQRDAESGASALQVEPSRPSGRRVYQRLSGGSDTKWHLAGYADATFEAADADGETTTNFSTARFNPLFLFQYKDIVLLEAEAEISVDDDGETEFELEYAQADLFVHDNLTLVLGQFLSPVGQFQERLHPSWINRMADAPPGFGHDGVQPTSELGVMARGGVSIGRTLVTYALAVGNGPTVAHEGGVVFEASGADDNSNKAVSGRLGFLPVPYLEVGGSFLVGDVSGIDDEMEASPDPMPALAPSSANVSLWGADAAYTRGPWDVRAEYLHATRDAIATSFAGSNGVEILPDLKLEAWYAQIAYSLSDITSHPVLQKFEPVVRYGEYKVNGLDELAEEAAEKRIDVGVNYWLAPSIVARGVVGWRDFTARPAGEPSSVTRYMLQFAYGF
jgi:hypothetical protein